MSTLTATASLSEQEARGIVDAIPQTIVVLSPDGAALYGNRSMLAYTGLTIDEVMAADFRARVFHPEDVARLLDQRRHGLARGVPFELEQRARRQDGQYRWFLVQYNPVRDEHGRTVRWYATGTDIDDRKRVEERTRNENLALREDIDRTSMFEEIIGSSPACSACWRKWRRWLRPIPQCSSSVKLGPARSWSPAPFTSGPDARAARSSG